MRAKATHWVTEPKGQTRMASGKMAGRLPKILIPEAPGAEAVCGPMRPKGARVSRGGHYPHGGTKWQEMQ